MNTLTPSAESAPIPITGSLTEKQYTNFAFALHKRIRGMVDKHTRVMIIPAAPNPAGYSHVDILIDQDSSHSLAEIARTIDRQRHKLNSSFTLYINKSVNSQNVRIYLHSIEHDAFDFALQYKAFNGIGAIIGVLAKQAGFHLSPHGLTYVNPDTPATDANDLGMLVTRDWREMLLLFRYSPKQYKQGYDGLFKNPAQVYEFAAHTAYFNKALFDAPYTMPDSTDMNEQGALAGFMDWVHHPDQADIYQSTEQHHAQLADSVLDRARRQFPDFQAALERGDTESIDIRKAADQVTAQHDRNQLMADAGISSRTTFRTATRWLQREQGGREGLDRWLLSTTYNDLVARLAELKADIEVRKT